MKVYKQRRHRIAYDPSTIEFIVPEMELYIKYSAHINNILFKSYVHPDRSPTQGLLRISVRFRRQDILVASCIVWAAESLRSHLLRLISIISYGI